MAVFNVVEMGLVEDVVVSEVVEADEVIWVLEKAGVVDVVEALDIALKVALEVTDVGSVGVVVAEEVVETLDIVLCA